MSARHPHHRRRTSSCGEPLGLLQADVDPATLALLLQLGHGDAGAGLLRMVRTVGALPPDLRTALEAEARADDDA